MTKCEVILLATIARQTFVGGPGSILLIILMLGVVNFAGNAILHGMGKGKMAMFLDYGTYFTVFVMVIAIIFKAVSSVFEFLKI